MNFRGALRRILRRSTIQAEVSLPPTTPKQYDDRPQSEEVDADLAYLVARNLTSTALITDPSVDVVVSMTTHGPRISRAFLALEAIARGEVLPGRMVLALSESDAARPLPDELDRLVARGLEILVVPDKMRVHTKYWGVVSETAQHKRPLVVGDDDQLYPEDWLARLLAVAADQPGRIVAHRAHRIRLAVGGGIAPYLRWPPFQSMEASFAAFPTGVSGTYFPPEFLDALHSSGTAFLEHAPNADDVWLHSRAVAWGFKVAQTSEVSANYPFVPETQHVGLYLSNVHGDANDRQIRASYSAEAIERIESDPFAAQPLESSS